MGVCRIEISIDWSQSLKDKRMVVKSLLDRIKSRYNASAAEVAEQDNLITGVLGVSVVSNDSKLINSTLDKIINLVDKNTEAEIVKVDREILYFE